MEFIPWIEKTRLKPGFFDIGFNILSILRLIWFSR